MNKNSLVIICFLVFASAIWSLFSFPSKHKNWSEIETLAVASNNEHSYGVHNGIMKSGGTQMIDSKDYEYFVGQRLANLLLNKCNLSFGRIQRVDLKENAQIQQIILRVEEEIFGELPDNSELSLFLDVNPTAKGSYEERLLARTTELPIGKTVFAGTCVHESPLSSRSLIVSEEKYFSTIRDAFEIHKLISVNNFVAVSQSAKSVHEKTLLAGYVVKYAQRMGSTMRSGTIARLLVDLLDSEIVPKRRWGGVRSVLFLMLMPGGSLSPPLKKSIMYSIVNIAASHDPIRAKSAIMILVSLVDEGEIDIRPFLSERNYAQIQKNYIRLVRDEYTNDVRQKFESQLVQKKQ